METLKTTRIPFELGVKNMSIWQKVVAIKANVHKTSTVTFFLFLF